MCKYFTKCHIYVNATSVRWLYNGFKKNQCYAKRNYIYPKYLRIFMKYFISEINFRMPQLQIIGKRREYPKNCPINWTLNDPLLLVGSSYMQNGQLMRK